MSGEEQNGVAAQPPVAGIVASELVAYLQRELHGAKTSCSAEAKRNNRLATRNAVLERALEKRRAQERHDQAYIDALEVRLPLVAVKAARAEISARRQRLAPPEASP
ncbi:MAG: hypothetical protein NUW01_02875 [Gemmatimonadaceae bacterium]|nr:hypothetical protein [Gemmatimonadaceae bacterium]